MLLRIAVALGVSTDEILGVEPDKTGDKNSEKIMKRVERIRSLPLHQQKILLQNIDMFLKGASANKVS